jgi:hypothetical protein
MVYYWLQTFEENLGIWGTFFGHVMSKTCEYVMNDDKVLSQRRHEWEKACIESGM